MHAEAAEPLIAGIHARFLVDGQAVWMEDARAKRACWVVSIHKRPFPGHAVGAARAPRVTVVLRLVMRIDPDLPLRPKARQDVSVRMCVRAKLRSRKKAERSFRRTRRFMHRWASRMRLSTRLLGYLQMAKRSSSLWPRTVVLCFPS